MPSGGRDGDGHLVGVVGIGVDVVDVHRFAALLERRPELVTRLFTPVEVADAAGAPPRLAVRFAAKEAVLKALQSGLGAARWHDIEVRRETSGAPHLVLRGAAEELARRCGAVRLHVSLSHTDQTATAFVVGEDA